MSDKSGSPAKGENKVADQDANYNINNISPDAVSKLPCPAPPANKVWSAQAPELYLNREFSWIEFNKRVLSEAADTRTPLLERIKFLSIASTNIDDFYMKRIGGLKQQIGAGVSKLSVDGRTPEQQLFQCIAKIREFRDEISRTHVRTMAELAGAGIAVRKMDELSSSERESLKAFFLERILPLITPLPIKRDAPLPFISNLSLNLFVEFSRPERKKTVAARIKIPDPKLVPRFIKLGTKSREFVLIEDVIVAHLNLLFPDMKVLSSGLFRITRNAISDMDPTGANDLLEVIESQLRNRKFAPVVRLQTCPGISGDNARELAQKLGLDHIHDVFENDDVLGGGDLMELAGCGADDLLYPPMVPIDNPSLDPDRPIFESIRRAGSILVQHPYESFVTSVKRLVREASTDPQVLSIKMTLYRTSADTKVIEYLVDAARNGKQVAVVVELQARFDEAANIEWATRLEKAGIHVNYGVLGLKTHCKTILIVRQEADGLRRYAHVGTGNYHAGTARLYSDLGLLTCDEDLADDLTELYNYLTTRWSSHGGYRDLLVGPHSIKKALIKKIDREISQHSPLYPGLIRFKVNALEDVDIVDALYKASQAGVKVELIIRDICRLRPGVEGLSENISVISVVGRFLEHSRIFYFRNGGVEEYFIGSADLMNRNLERRVEVLAPVRNLPARDMLEEIFETQLGDFRSAWEMKPGGEYVQRRSEGGKPVQGCQQLAIASANSRKRTAFSTRPPQPGQPETLNGARPGQENANVTR